MLDQKCIKEQNFFLFVKKSEVQLVFAVSWQYGYLKN